MHEIEALRALFDSARAHNTRVALATVVDIKGSAYRRPGARMLLCEDGRSAGIINGGCLDADLWANAREVIEGARARTLHYDTTSPQDIVFGLGLGCRGIVRVFVEPVEDLGWLRFGARLAVIYEGNDLGTRSIGHDAAPAGAFVQTIEAPQELLIFGAGADAVPLWEFGRALGWNVRAFDLRAHHPGRVMPLRAQHIAPEKLSELEIPRGAAGVIMTHNFLHDFEILKRLLTSNASYIGVLGPRRRTAELLDKIGDSSLTPGIAPTAAQLARLHAPVGLDLGAETPEEIALAIIAEIQKVRRQKSGQSLRDRDAIH